MVKKKIIKKRNSKKKAHISNKKNQVNSTAFATFLLILNIFIPGFGSILGGKTNEGIYQLILFFSGAIVGFLLSSTLIGLPLGAPIIIGGPIAAWIWGIVTSAQILRESK